MSDVVKLIIEDTQRLSLSTGRSLVLLTLLASLAIGLGYGLRLNLDGAFTTATLLGGGAILLGVGFMYWLGQRLRAPRTGTIALCLTLVVTQLILSLKWPLSEAYTSYAGTSEFLSEAMLCLCKGLLAGFFAASFMVFFMGRLLPIADLTMRLVLSAMAGFVGLAMLAFHCPSDNFAHLVLGHWTAALGAFVGCFAWLSWRFSAILKSALGTRRHRLKNLSRIG